MDVVYKLCKSPFTEELRFPVYAGENGSIVVFNTVEGRWQQLNQTHDKTNGYWVVSIPKKMPGQEKPRLERDVHRLICIAWHGEPSGVKQIRVDHVNGDPDDNSAGNLRWIDSTSNAAKATLHQKQFPSDFSKVVILCDSLNIGRSIVDSVLIVKADGAQLSARHLIGHGKGRPPTRIASVIEALFREALPPEVRPEKSAQDINSERVVRLGIDDKTIKIMNYFGQG